MKRVHSATHPHDTLRDEGRNRETWLPPQRNRHTSELFDNFRGITSPRDTPGGVGEDGWEGEGQRRIIAVCVCIV